MVVLCACRGEEKCYETLAAPVHGEFSLALSLHGTKSKSYLEVMEAVALRVFLNCNIQHLQHPEMATMPEELQHCLFLNH